MKKNRKRSQEAQQEEQIPPLKLVDKNGKELIAFPYQVVENLRLMVSRLCRKAPLPERLALLASLRQEGTTYISRALGLTMANDLDTTVAIVELNWWWPSPLPVGESGKGLANVLSGEISLEEVIVPTGNPRLSLIPSGQMPIEKRPVFARSKALREVIARLNERFDHLILDLPAVLATNDAIALAELGTVCCLVVRQGVTSIENVRLALDDLEDLPIAGVIMNQVKLATPAFLLKFIPQQ